MKSVLLASLLSVCVVGGAAAQNVRLTVVGGGRLGGTVQGWNSELSVKESASVGVRLGVALDEERRVELLYSLQDSEVRGYTYGRLEAVVDLDVAYYHLTVVQDFDGVRVTPYMVGGLGLTHFSSSEGSVSSVLRFSMLGGGGVDIPLTERIGFLVDGRVYVTFVSDSTYVGVGTGGATVGFSGSAFFQAEANAGIYLQF
jgi:hypothetical protein